MATSCCNLFLHLPAMYFFHMFVPFFYFLSKFLHRICWISVGDEHGYQSSSCTRQLGDQNWILALFPFFSRSSSFFPRILPLYGFIFPIFFHLFLGFSIFFLGFFPPLFSDGFPNFFSFSSGFCSVFCWVFAPSPPGANTAALPGIAGGVPTKRSTGQGTNDAGGRRPAAWRG